MKQLALLMFALVVLTSCAAFGQGAAASQWVLGVKAEGGVPTGDFKNATDFGFGGTVWAGYMFDPSCAVTLRSGYTRFSGKDYIIQGVTVKTNYGVVPITAGLRYYFMPGDTRVYGAAEAGLYLLNASADATVNGVTVSASTNESKFGINPTLGVQFKAGDKMNVDVHGAYTDVFTDVSSTAWIDFGIGLEFMLQ
ncbi:MAG TPA: outer membrane beta-barrel protein [Bacteroidota bacterium]|jgi:opacity protein-like surface antigen